MFFCFSVFFSLSLLSSLLYFFVALTRRSSILTDIEMSTEWFWRFVSEFVNLYMIFHSSNNWNFLESLCESYRMTHFNWKKKSIIVIIHYLSNDSTLDLAFSIAFYKIVEIYSEIYTIFFDQQWKYLSEKAEFLFFFIINDNFFMFFH